ncbi:hypothetical protein AA313_de0206980 [Arthrobotrys entomopaga]|nr:hypothetical protein AA313_de0206980 [Arthrobotrys entomopaga]
MVSNLQIPLVPNHLQDSLQSGFGSQIKSQDFFSLIQPLINAINGALDSIADKANEWYPVLQKILNDIIDFCKKHPDLLLFILLTAGGLSIIPILLRIAGFSLSGVVPGSFAAAWQSTIGDVAAGSFFAFLQSCGAAPAAVAVTGALIGFGAFVWVEINKTWYSDSPSTPSGPSGPAKTGGDDKNSGMGRRGLNPFYTGYRIVRRGLDWRL